MTQPTQAQIEWRLRRALEALVALKDYKETHGADEYYQKGKHAAWADARLALTAAAQVGEQRAQPLGGADKLIPKDLLERDNATIERCAQRLEQLAVGGPTKVQNYFDAAAAIRKLKDEP